MGDSIVISVPKSGISALFIHSRNCKKFAGKVVAAMINKGCNGPLMDRRGISKSVYYSMLGSGTKYNGKTPGEMADKFIKQFRPDYMFESKPMTDWEADCYEFHGKFLHGTFQHYCAEFDGLPIDETCKEFDHCKCFDEKPLDEHPES